MSLVSCHVAQWLYNLICDIQIQRPRAPTPGPGPPSNPAGARIRSKCKSARVRSLPVRQAKRLSTLDASSSLAALFIAGSSLCCPSTPPLRLRRRAAACASPAHGCSIPSPCPSSAATRHRLRPRCNLSMRLSPRSRCFCIWFVLPLFNFPPYPCSAMKPSKAFPGVLQ